MSNVEEQPNEFRKIIEDNSLFEEYDASVIRGMHVEVRDATSEVPNVDRSEAIERRPMVRDELSRGSEERMLERFNDGPPEDEGWVEVAVVTAHEASEIERIAKEKGIDILLDGNIGDGPPVSEMMIRVMVKKREGAAFAWPVLEEDWSL